MEDESTWDSFTIADPNSRKRKSLLPANKTANSTNSDLDLEEDVQSSVWGIEKQIQSL